MGKPEGKRLPERPRKDSIKIYVQEIGWVD